MSVSVKRISSYELKNPGYCFGEFRFESRRGDPPGRPYPGLSSPQRPGYKKSALGLQKGIQIEGPQRSLEIIVAGKGKTPIPVFLRRPEKIVGIHKPDVPETKVNHIFPVHDRLRFPYYIHQSANVQSLFFTVIMTKASLFRPVWSWGDRLKTPLTPGQFFTFASR